LPLKPIVIPRYADIDPEIANLTVIFWNNIWNKKNPAIELKTKLLLSLANAVGLGRIRQSTRELIKAYFLGVTVEQFDELFSLIIWNQGIAHFSSEIAQSPFFKAYLLIKKLEKKGTKRNEIIAALTEKFGENNPEMGFNNPG
jgi:alkylhydroperoxidase/carboxymuconolactone decarboxylase family protein YurZ